MLRACHRLNISLKASARGPVRRLPPAHPDWWLREAVLGAGTLSPSPEAGSSFGHRPNGEYLKLCPLDHLRCSYCATEATTTNT